MKFRVQIWFVLLLIAIVAPTVLAQTSPKKNPRPSQVASLQVSNLLVQKSDSTDAGGLANPAPNVNPSANEEGKPVAVDSALKSLRAGVASLDAGHYKDA